MKKLIAMIIGFVLALSASADTYFLGKTLLIPASAIKENLDSKLPDFTKIIGATNAVYKINKNLPNLPERENGVECCCELEVEIQFKATKVDEGYALLRSMACSRYGKYEAATPIKALGKKCIMWWNEKDQILLYVIGEKIYLHFFIGSRIVDTFGNTFGF